MINNPLRLIALLASKMALAPATLGCVVAVHIFSAPCFAASIVVDTFNEGTFLLSNDQSDFRSDVQFGDMLGGFRSVGISTMRRRTTVTAELVEGTSLLSFDTGDGPGLGGGLGTGLIAMGWNSNPSLSLLGLDAFVLNVTTLNGQGEVHIGINEQGFGTSSTWIPLTAAGSFRVPFDQVDVGSGSLSGVYSLRLAISGTSPDFGLSIDELAIIPEPSTVMQSLWAVALSFARRNRKCKQTMADQQAVRQESTPL